MTYAEQLRSDYAAVRARLFNPPHAVPDNQFRFPQDCRAPEDEAECMLKGGKKAAIARAKRAHKNRLGIPWLDILNEVAKKYDLPPASLKSENYARGIITDARNELYYRMREAGLSNTQIGRLLKRDPSTVAAGALKWKKTQGL